ncbi:MAG: hypothetical protein FWG20_06995 [Candidatus Cloacimonetes bacterium]|nr:hypothetical protein [Candidatus Cloacimonadota bacterium]
MTQFTVAKYKYAEVNGMCGFYSTFEFDTSLGFLRTHSYVFFNGDQFQELQVSFNGKQSHEIEKEKIYLNSVLDSFLLNEIVEE